MAKLVSLKFLGNLQEKGFKIHLEIGEENSLPYLQLQEIENLPANKELVSLINRHWLEKYRPLASPYRIKPGAIHYDGEINPATIEDCNKSANLVEEKFNSWLDSESLNDINNTLREQLNTDEEIRGVFSLNDKYIGVVTYYWLDIISDHVSFKQ